MRATIDLDDPSEIDVIQSWHRLANHGDGHVFGRVSASGEGVHLKVHGCDPENVESIRRECGDDPKRMEYDRKTTLKPKQILFTSKPHAGKAGEWTDDMDHVVAEYRRLCPVEIRYPEARR